MEQKMTLAELPSGKVELVWTGLWVLLQFNCSCLDALPYCHAMCCRSFSIGCSEEEAHKFQTRPHPISKVPTLYRDKWNTCIYLQEDCKCGVHQDKPGMCQRWHCSPGGELKDERIERRDAGWLINLVRQEEYNLVQLNLQEDGK